MKTTKHIEQLLRQGRKPRELVQLGFPKSVVTRIRRRLDEEKATPQKKVEEQVPQTETSVQALPEAPEKIAAIWQKLQSMSNDMQEIDGLIPALSEVTSVIAAAEAHGAQRRETCPFREDGHCVVTAWTSSDDIPQGIGEPMLVEGEKPSWYIKPSSYYCAMCTALIEIGLEDVEKDVSDDPLSGARSQITCESCGSKGYIAAAVMCTKCHHQTYWGWSPKK